MKKILNVILILIVITPASIIKAEVSYTKNDSLVYVTCINNLKGDSSRPANELMVKVALYLKNTPYVASTLERNIEEQLVINLGEFDCTTFVETCAALSLTLKSGNYSFTNYCNLLKQLRYRDGKIDGYTSRLHYVSDWIHDNTEIFKDETQYLGGVLEKKNINFMSTHTTSYKPLRDDINLQSKIEVIESDINKRGGYYILKKNLISENSDKIKDGDIIAFATSISGLDYSHIGIAYHDNDKLTFIHASTRTMMVTIESVSLPDYCNNSKKCTGVSVFRLID